MVESSAVTIFTEVVRLKINSQKTDLSRSKDVFISENKDVHYVRLKRTLTTKNYM